MNVFLLAFTAYVKGYESSYWLTYNQAKMRDGNVRSGEKSSMVVFWKQYKTKDRETGEDKKIPVLRYYNVFNLGQIEGIEAPDAVSYTPTDFQAIEAAESIVAGYTDPPNIEHGGSQAFYHPDADTVRLPEPTRFTSAEEYYATLFHELAHSTGHSKRLGRLSGPNTLSLGSAAYGREELIAEMAAAFLSSETGINPEVLENQTAYIGGWMKRIKEDKKLVIASASSAQRAADWILGERGAPD